MTDNRNSERIECSPNKEFIEWLATAGGSVIVSTYQAGKLLMLGWSGRQITLLLREYEKPMGIDVSGKRLFLATRNGITAYANDPLLAHEYLEPGRYDALYLPRVTWHTNDINTHDLAYGNKGLWVVNTRFSCLSLLDDEYTFLPRWSPPFITEVAPEDRCHLNGLAMEKGEPKFVTCLGQSNTPGGWRDGKTNGGVIIDVETNEIILGGLAMPHSPRMHNGKLWVLNSGEGTLEIVDAKSGTSEVVCSLQGYLRGLTFIGDRALVGLCKIRQSNVFGGMPVQNRHEKLLCGVAVININNGSQEGFFEFKAGCEEIYDIRFLPGIFRPNILNLDKPATQQAISAPDFSYWLRPQDLVKDYNK